MEIEHDENFYSYTVEHLKNGSKTVISVSSDDEWIGSVIFNHHVQSAVAKIGEYSAHLNYLQMKQLTDDELARWIINNQ